MRTLNTSGRNTAALKQTGLVCALLMTLALLVPLRNSFTASATNAPTESTILLDSVGAPSLEGIEAGHTSTVCSSLNAFINECHAQSGKMLTGQQATQLITAATQIKTGLGCQ